MLGDFGDFLQSAHRGDVLFVISYYYLASFIFYYVVPGKSNSSFQAQKGCKYVCMLLKLS
jgi:hypothetical protein